MLVLNHRLALIFTRKTGRSLAVDTLGRPAVVWEAAGGPSQGGGEIYFRWWR